MDLIPTEVMTVIFKCILSFHLLNGFGFVRWVYDHHLTEEETETERVEASCPMLHNCWFVNPGLNSKSASLRRPYLFHHTQPPQRHSAGGIRAWIRGQSLRSTQSWSRETWVKFLDFLTSVTSHKPCFVSIDFTSKMTRCIGLSKPIVLCFQAKQENTHCQMKKVSQATFLLYLILECPLACHKNKTALTVSLRLSPLLHWSGVHHLLWSQCSLRECSALGIFCEQPTEVWGK